MPSRANPLGTLGGNPPPSHVEQQRDSQRMQDKSELDGLRPNVGTSFGKPVTLPWSTGRALRSAGRTNPRTGLPVTPLDALNLPAAVTPAESARLDRELAKARVQDAASEGVLDHAAAMEVPLEVSEQWWEAQPQAAVDEAAVAAELQADAIAEALGREVASDDELPSPDHR